MNENSRSRAECRPPSSGGSLVSHGSHSRDSRIYSSIPATRPETTYRHGIRVFARSRGRALHFETLPRLYPLINASELVDLA